MTDGSKIFCFCSKWFRLRRVFARVTKLVDVEDLKSSALIRRVGSIPTPGTKKRPKGRFLLPGSKAITLPYVWESNAGAGPDGFRRERGGAQTNPSDDEDLVEGDFPL